MKQKVRKLSIKGKILIVCGLMIVVVVALMGFTFNLRSEKDMTKMGVEQAQAAARIAASQMNGDILNGLAPGDESREDYQAQLEKLRTIQSVCGVRYLYILTTDQKKVYYAMDTDIDRTQVIGEEFEESYEELADAFDGNEYVQDFIDYTEEGDLISAYIPIRDSQGTVVGLLGSDYDAASVVATLNNTTQRILLIGGISLIASLFLFSLVIGQIMKGLKRVNSKIYDLVHNEGDLTQTLDVRSGDELELMAGNVNELLAYIRGIMLRISDNSQKLNKSAQLVAEHITGTGESVMDVSATIEEMSASVEETTASVNEVVAAIAEIYNDVNNIAAKAQQGNASAEMIAQKAQELYSDAEAKQVQAQEMAREMTDSVNEKIAQSKSVSEINTLTEDIIAITSQTNLLALNASIEAARAGEAGRGFAVVAEEIGNLANNSAETAAKIKDVSNQVISSVEGLSIEAENMVRFVEETALGGYRRLLAASEDYSNDAANIHTIMRDFAQHAEHLGKAIDDIRDSVQTVNTAMEENAKGISGVAENSTRISSSTSDISAEADGNKEIAKLLENEVGKFKLE